MPFTDVCFKTAVDPTHCNRRTSAGREAADRRTFRASAVLSVTLAVRIADAATNARNAAISQD